jgi:hypothetical protein
MDIFLGEGQKVCTIKKNSNEEKYPREGEKVGVLRFSEDFFENYCRFV